LQKLNNRREEADILLKTTRNPDTIRYLKQSKEKFLKDLTHLSSEESSDDLPEGRGFLTRAKSRPAAAEEEGKEEKNECNTFLEKHRPCA
jgi:hypothetical protein